MTNITRRDLLCGISLLSVAGGSVGYPLIDNRSMDRSALNEELAHVLACWTKTEPLAPRDYLLSKGIDIHDRSAIDEMIKQNFEENETIEIRGLVLAKTEAAVVSLMVESLLPVNV